jgi:hypothetical protein
MLQSLTDRLRNWLYPPQITTPDEPPEIARPEHHCCPYCGAGITQLILQAGGILPRKGLTQVKAMIRCHSCKRQHTLQGATPYERGVVLILLDQPRRSWKRDTIFRNGNVR